MAQQLLLLEDVHGLGLKGEVVNVKAKGYVRNFLLPKLRREGSNIKRSLAVFASANMVRKQEQLRAERAAQAVIDLKESNELKAQIESVTLETRVAVDAMGNMYGSVSAADIAQIFAEKGIPVEKRFVLLNKPFKETGKYKISLKLKEGITTSCDLIILAEGATIDAGVENVVAPIVETEASTDESN